MGGRQLELFYLANSDLNGFVGPLFKSLLQGHLLNLRFEVGPPVEVKHSNNRDFVGDFFFFLPSLVFGTKGLV